MELDININPHLACPSCKTDISVSKETDGKMIECTECNSNIEVFLFPELFARTEAVRANNVSEIDQEACCFFHENKVATSHCTQCGRFICKLCELDIGDECLCPSCASGDNKTKKVSLKNRSVLYDKIALYLTLYPVLLIITFYFTIFTAPLGIIVAIRYWNRQETILPRGKWRFIVALIIGVIEVLVWIGILYSIFHFGSKAAENIQGVQQ